MQLSLDDETYVLINSFLPKPLDLSRYSYDDISGLGLMGLARLVAIFVYESLKIHRSRLVSGELIPGAAYACIGYIMEKCGVEQWPCIT